MAYFVAGHRKPRALLSYLEAAAMPHDAEPSWDYRIIVSMVLAAVPFHDGLGEHVAQPCISHGPVMLEFINIAR
ncbi:MAG: hypothetical protein JSS20_20195 [Proteobacteria bacterium]|nr:hypothetical protein [Pseudomonadota bacterium]